MERNQELVREAHRIAAGDDGILSRNEEIKFYKELGIDYTFKKNSRYALYNKADIWATFSEDGRIIERVSNEALENFVMKQGGKR